MPPAHTEESRARLRKAFNTTAERQRRAEQAAVKLLQLRLISLARQESHPAAKDALLRAAGVIGLEARHG